MVDLSAIEDFSEQEILLGCVGHDINSILEESFKVSETSNRRLCFQLAITTQRLSQQH